MYLHYYTFFREQLIGYLFLTRDNCVELIGYVNGQVRFNVENFINQH